MLRERQSFPDTHSRSCRWLTCSSLRRRLQVQRGRSALDFTDQEAYQAELMMMEGDEEQWVMLEESDAPEEAFVFNEDSNVAKDAAALQDTAVIKEPTKYHREPWRTEPTVCDICLQKVTPISFDLPG